MPPRSGPEISAPRPRPMDPSKSELPSNMGSESQSKTDKRVRVWKIFSTAVIVLLAFGLAYLLAWRSDIFNSAQTEASCSDNVHLGLSNIVPMPHDVAQMAHRPMLDKLRDYKSIPSLLDAHANVRSSVKETNWELIEHLACALSKYSSVNSKKSRIVLFKVINIVREHVRHTVVSVSQLADLYSPLQLAYQTQHSNTVRALERTQLDREKSYKISTQPLLLSALGLNYTKIYWDPWEESKRNLKRIRPSMVTLERELERLERIDQITREINNSLGILADSLIRKDGGTTHNLNRLLWQDSAPSKGSSPRESRSKKWFWQHVARHVEED